MVPEATALSLQAWTKKIEVAHCQLVPPCYCRTCKQWHCSTSGGANRWEEEGVCKICSSGMHCDMLGPSVNGRG